MRAGWLCGSEQGHVLRQNEVPLLQIAAGHHHFYGTPAILLLLRCQHELVCPDGRLGGADRRHVLTKPSRGKSRLPVLQLQYPIERQMLLDGPNAVRNRERAEPERLLGVAFGVIHESESKAGKLT